MPRVLARFVREGLHTLERAEEVLGSGMTEASGEVSGLLISMGLGQSREPSEIGEEEDAVLAHPLRVYIAIAALGNRLGDCCRCGDVGPRRDMSPSRRYPVAMRSGETKGAIALGYLALVSIGGLVAVALSLISPWVWLGILAMTFAVTQLGGRFLLRNGRARDHHSRERVLVHHQ